MSRLSYFGRVQYDFMNKYLFEANLRADASSRFQKIIAGVFSQQSLPDGEFRKKHLSKTMYHGLAT